MQDAGRTVVGRAGGELRVVDLFAGEANQFAAGVRRVLKQEGAVNGSCTDPTNLGIQPMRIRQALFVRGRQALLETQKSLVAHQNEQFQDCCTASNNSS